PPRSGDRSLANLHKVESRMGRSLFWKIYDFARAEAWSLAAKISLAGPLLWVRSKPAFRQSRSVRSLRRTKTAASAKVKNSTSLIRDVAPHLGQTHGPIPQRGA